MGEYESGVRSKIKFIHIIVYHYFKIIASGTVEGFFVFTPILTIFDSVKISGYGFIRKTF
jgi:hypothetical protein